MNDIVNELRESHRQWSDGEEGCRDCGTNHPCVSQRAANEIMRMRQLIYRLEMESFAENG